MSGLGGGIVQTTNYLRGGEDVVDADKVDVSRKEDIKNAIYAVAAKRLNSEKGTNFSPQELSKKYNDEFKEVVNAVTTEWDSLVATGNIEEIKKSDVYNETLNYAEITLSDEQVRKNVTNFVEAFKEDHNKGDAQEYFQKELEDKYKELNEKSKQVLNESNLLEKQAKFLEKQLETESKWLKENEQKLVNELKTLTSKKYTSEKQRDKASLRVNEIRSELIKHYNAFNRHAQDLKSISLAGGSLRKEVNEVLKDEADFKRLADLMSKQYGWVDQTGYSLGNATIDLLQGIATAVEATAYLVLPTGFLADYVIDKTTHPVVKAFGTATKQLGILGSGRFDNDANTTSITQHLHRSLDKWQEKWGDTIQEPPKYDDIKTWSDFGEWFGVMFSGQVPQLALMLATGGQSAWLQTAILAGSAGGQKFMGMEEDRDLFLESGGLYGQDYNFLQMYLSGAAVGIVEGLSEQITFGQLKGVAKALKGNKAAQAGYFKHLYNVAVKEGGLKRSGIDMFKEGGSEVIASVGENFVDILNGDVSVGIFDNVEESFVSGALISSTIKTPLVFNEMYKPFQSPDNKAKIDIRQKKIDDLINNVISLGRPGQEQEFDAAQAEIEKLVAEQMKFLEQDIRRVD